MKAWLFSEYPKADQMDPYEIVLICLFFMADQFI